MSSTTTRRVATVLALTALLALPARPAKAAVRHASHPTGTGLGFFDGAWSFLADLLGTPSGASPTTGAGHHGFTARHANLGGFIDPDGARFLSLAPGTTALNISANTT
jgi:hypothetical protein